MEHATDARRENVSFLEKFSKIFGGLTVQFIAEILAIKASDDGNRIAFKVNLDGKDTWPSLFFKGRDGKPVLKSDDEAVIRSLRVGDEGDFVCGVSPDGKWLNIKTLKRVIDVRKEAPPAPNEPEWFPPEMDDIQETDRNTSIVRQVGCKCSALVLAAIIEKGIVSNPEDIKDLAVGVAQRYVEYILSGR